MSSSVKTPRSRSLSTPSAGNSASKYKLSTSTKITQERNNNFKVFTLEDEMLNSYDSVVNLS